MRQCRLRLRGRRESVPAAGLRGTSTACSLRPPRRLGYRGVLAPAWRPRSWRANSSADWGWRPDVDRDASNRTDQYVTRCFLPRRRERLDYLCSTPWRADCDPDARRRQDLERRVLNVSGLSCIRQRPPLVCYPAGKFLKPLMEDALGRNLGFRIGQLRRREVSVPGHRMDCEPGQRELHSLPNQRRRFGLERVSNRGTERRNASRRRVFLDQHRGWLITWHSSGGSYLFATRDGGRNWAPEPDRSFQGAHRWANCVRFLSDRLGFIFEDEDPPGRDSQWDETVVRLSNLLYTSDGGSHWHKLALPNHVSGCQVFDGDLLCTASGKSSGLIVLTVHPERGERNAVTVGM